MDMFTRKNCSKRPMLFSEREKPYRKIFGVMRDKIFGEWKKLRYIMLSYMHCILPLT